jgi:SAM-dependent MidA family methyltransferase
MAEVAVAARQWIGEVAAWMERGILLTIDYGGETGELLMRSHGTLRAYREHRLLTDLYQMPGEMDLTAHVDFTSLRHWGESLHMRTLAYLTQADFLLRAGVLDLLPSKPVPDPFSPEAKRRRAITQLIHPQGMGESFRVLLQAKGMPALTRQQLFPNL